MTGPASVLSSFLPLHWAAKFRPVGNDHNGQTDQCPHHCLAYSLQSRSTSSSSQGTTPKPESGGSPRILAGTSSPVPLWRGHWESRIAREYKIPVALGLVFYIHAVKEQISTILTWTNSNLFLKIHCIWIQRKGFLFAKSSEYPENALNSECPGERGDRDEDLWKQISSFTKRSQEAGGQAVASGEGQTSWWGGEGQRRIAEPTVQERRPGLSRERRVRICVPRFPDDPREEEKLEL